MKTALNCKARTPRFLARRRLQSGHNAEGVSPQKPVFGQWGKQRIEYTILRGDNAPEKGTLCTHTGLDHLYQSLAVRRRLPLYNNNKKTSRVARERAVPSPRSHRCKQPAARRPRVCAHVRRPCREGVLSHPDMGAGRLSHPDTGAGPRGLG